MDTPYHKRIRQIAGHLRDEGQVIYPSELDAIAEEVAQDTALFDENNEHRHELIREKFELQDERDKLTARVAELEEQAIQDAEEIGNTKDICAEALHERDEALSELRAAMAEGE